MNSENFSDFIEQPSHLYQIPYEELKSLVMQYPYCQNLRYLLLKKSMMENHREFDRNLHLAATFSPDRAYLFKQIRKSSQAYEVQENYELTEDYLELKDLNEIKSSIEERMAEFVELKEENMNSLVFDPGPSNPDDDVPAPAFSEPALPPTDEDIDDPIVPVQETAEIQDPSLDLTETILNFAASDAYLETLDLSVIFEEATVVEKPTARTEPLPELAESKFQVPAEFIDDIIAIAPLPEFVPVPEQKELLAEAVELAQEDTSGKEAPPEPEKETETPNIELEITNEAEPAKQMVAQKESFSSWLKQFKSPTVSQQLSQMVEAETPKKKKKKKSKLSEAARLARESIREHGVASETLAWLLEKQEHYSKALDMYTLLVVQKPERAAHYKKKIRELKDKI